MAYCTGVSSAPQEKLCPVKIRQEAVCREHRLEVWEEPKHLGTGAMSGSAQGRSGPTVCDTKGASQECVPMARAPCGASSAGKSSLMLLMLPSKAAESTNASLAHMCSHVHACSLPGLVRASLLGLASPSCDGPWHVGQALAEPGSRRGSGDLSWARGGVAVCPVCPIRVTQVSQLGEAPGEDCRCGGA